MDTSGIEKSLDVAAEVLPPEKPKLKKKEREIDIDKDQEIAKQAGINGTPTVQLFKEKLLKKQWQGVKQRSEFKEAIKEII